MNVFAKIAYNEALKSTMNNRYGAVLVLRGKVVGKGHNYSLINSTEKKSCILCE